MGGWCEGRWWLSSSQERKTSVMGPKFNHTLSLGALDTWATSLVKCRSEKRPTQMLSQAAGGLDRCIRVGGMG